ncbi:hypothetical protein SAMN04489761_3026 [Tenacibaculum sp. MAR_2009_124]|uniref:hypothetical protein n=1 Tax=Tenacibaculum sp. MAR_2009_124 TaxID=1250059 RepID=UPI00089A5E0E|nr:hypothetical protein [Tenacibaculum sp. MAR_2009_124]SEC45030.1 hypothetical protein SAMN04489761_3026 [Tenacibaculum sp. MAR_2009_124]
MNTIKLNIKQRSVNKFFLDHSVLPERLPSGKHIEDVSPYHLLRDEIYFKIDCDIKEGDSILIELKDKSRNSEKELVNLYTYTAEKYDDVSIKMVLDDFKVKVVESDDENEKSKVQG